MDDQGTLVAILAVAGGVLQIMLRTAGRKRWLSIIAEVFEKHERPATPVPMAMLAAGGNGGATQIIGQAIGVSDYLVKVLDGVQKNNNAMQFEMSALKVALDNEKRERADDRVKFQAQLGEKDVEIGALRGELRKAQLTIGDLEKRLDEQSKSHTDVISRLTARVAELEAKNQEKGSEA